MARGIAWVVLAGWCSLSASLASPSPRRWSGFALSAPHRAAASGAGVAPPAPRARWAVASSSSSSSRGARRAVAATRMAAAADAVATGERLTKKESFDEWGLALKVGRSVEVVGECHRWCRI